jgi:hypothetical protein
MAILGASAHSSVQSLTITRTATTTDQRWIIGRADSARRQISYHPVVRFVHAPSGVDLDLRDPISYQEFVAWGRSLMGGDTSGMLDI